MQRLILKPDNHDQIIATACQVLADGGLVVYPTETLYGIGVDATNQTAVNKLLAYKSRREGKPLSIAVVNQAMAEQYVELTQQAVQLYKNFLPGPITAVSKVKAHSPLAAGVASERQTVGIRMPDYPLIQQLVSSYGKPITATSANASYKKRPYNVSDILENISSSQAKLIDLIIDAGQLPHNEPSTVVDTTMEEPTVLRQGALQLSNSTTVTTHSEEETQELAQTLVKKYKHYLNEKALVFALSGEMGAGKTQFSKGIARALGITQPVTSPTFTLSREYSFSYGDQANQFVHIDTWRLFSEAEFLELGFKPLIDNLAVFSIEWADKVGHALTEWSDEAKIVWINFEYGATEEARIISYSDQPLIKP